MIVEAIDNTYTGAGKLNRLLFVASKSIENKHDALRLAADEIMRSTSNTALLAHVVAELGTIPGEQLAIYEDWTHDTNQSAKVNLSRLQQELGTIKRESFISATYKSNLIKESVRIAHNDLAEFYARCGDVNEAMKCNQKTKSIN